MSQSHDEPEEWRSALPMRSPLPIVLALAAIQVIVAGALVLYAVLSENPDRTEQILRPLR